MLRLWEDEVVDECEDRGLSESDDVGDAVEGNDSSVEVGMIVCVIV